MYDISVYLNIFELFWPLKVKLRLHNYIIMVLASPPRPPVDPDDVNALNNSQNIQWISFKVYMRVDTPWGELLLKFDTLRGLEQLRSQPNDTRIPQIVKMQYLHK